MLYTKHLKSNADRADLFITGFDTDEPKAYIDYTLAKAAAKKCNDPDIFRFALDDADDLLHSKYFNQNITLNDQLYITSIGLTTIASTNLTTVIDQIISQSEYAKLINVSVTELSASKLKLSLEYYSDRTIDGQPIVDEDDLTITKVEIADIKQSNFSDQNYFDPDESLLYESTRDTLMMFLDKINDDRPADKILTNRNLVFNYTNLESRFHKANSEDPLLIMISTLVRHALYDDETDKVTAHKVFDETIGMISAAGHAFIISWYKERGIIDQFNDEDGNSATFRNAIDIIEELIDKDFLKHPFKTYQKVMSEAF